LYQNDVADVLSLFYKLANPGAQLLVTTPFPYAHFQIVRDNFAKS